MEPRDPLLTQFIDLAESPDDEMGLADAAFLIAASEYPDLDIPRELAVLDSLSAAALTRFGGERDPLYCVNTLSDYLFVELGFEGNQDDYYDPRNSFLNEVLSRRLGIPISLCLVFLEVSKRLDIPMMALGMPGHLLLKHRDTEDLFVDPYNRGVLLTEEECAQRMRSVTQADIAWDSSYLSPINNREYIARMLRNLKAVYLERQDYNRALPMINRLVALYPGDPRERRDRGVVLYSLGDHTSAIDDLEFYLSNSPGATNEEIERLIGRLKGHEGNDVLP